MDDDLTMEINKKEEIIKEFDTREKSNNKYNDYILVLMFSLIAIFTLFYFSTKFENGLNIFLFVIVLFVIFFAIKMSSKVKDIVLSIGRKLLDIGTALDVVLALGIIIAGLFITNDEYSPFEIGIEWYIIGSIVFLLFALLKDYVLYLLIDIRDSLKKIADRENENSK